MIGYKPKSQYALNFEADKKILRAEFQNTIAPALNAALATLSERHLELENNREAPQRFCAAIEEIKEIVLEGTLKALGTGE